MKIGSNHNRMWGSGSDQTLLLHVANRMVDPDNEAVLIVTEPILETAVTIADYPLQPTNISQFGKPLVKRAKW